MKVNKTDNYLEDRFVVYSFIYTNNSVENELPNIKHVFVVCKFLMTV